MPTFNGVAVYEILPNGCLNGVYTNDHPNTQNEILNEIARKVLNGNGDINTGKYVCSYIDAGNVTVNCDLEITTGIVRKNGRSGQYDFKWYDTGKTTNPIFEGTGWLTRHNQITVSYRDC